MKNIQVIDGAANATFSIFQATDEEFALIFPGEGQDIEFIEDALEREGTAEETERALSNIWQRPVRKSDAMGIHGTLFCEWQDKKHHFALTKREIDTPRAGINQAQRELFARLGGKPE